MCSQVCTWWQGGANQIGVKLTFRNLIGFIFGLEGGLLLHATGFSVQQQSLNESLQYMANEWPQGQTAPCTVSAPVSPCHTLRQHSPFVLVTPTLVASVPPCLKNESVLNICRLPLQLNAPHCFEYRIPKRTGQKGTHSQ